MKKTLRMVSLSGLALLMLLMAALAVLPRWFEDDLLALLKRQINAQLQAQVDFQDLDLSFLRSFPNASIRLEAFEVVNQAPFLGDTLISGEQLDLEVDLMSIFRGDEYQIREVALLRPRVYVHVLPDGRANYDITLPDSSAADTTAAAPFQLSLQQYRLEQADLRYRDESLSTLARLQGLNHEGSGNFSDTQFLLQTTTDIAQTFLSYDGITYLDNLPLQALADLDIDVSEDLRVALRENEFRLNQFPLHLDGSVALPGDDIVLDLNFDSPGSSFGTLLSLVPSVFLTDMAGIQTEGELAFSGYLRGTYNDNSFPAYHLENSVRNARLAYPDLPESITGIQWDLRVDNPDGQDQSLVLDLTDFQARLGSNPLRAQLHLENLLRPDLDGRVSGDLNLAEVARFYPIEGTDLAGQLAIDATAKGRYDEAANQFPTVDGRFELRDGFVKSAEYQTELSDLQLLAYINSADAALDRVVAEVSRFHLLLDGVPLDGSGRVQNFDDPTYEVTAQGELDLGKMMALYPIDSMELAGRITINDLYAAGRYSDVEAERYDQLTNRGSVTVQSLWYRDLWYTQPGVTLDRGEATFTPQRISFSNLAGKLGQSPFTGSGYLTNYLAYLLMGSDELAGDLALQSPRFDANEWLAAMDSEPVASTDPTADGTGAAEEVPLEVYPIPAGYDLDIDLDVAELLYDDLSLSQVRGGVAVRNQALEMDNLRFGMLGGSVGLNGAYDTRDPQRANYDFFLDIENLGVKDAFQHFTIVQEFAPVARAINGVCNLELGLQGGLKPDFSPILEDVNAFGLFELLRGGLSNTPLTNALAANTNIGALQNWNLRDVSGQFRIDNGTVMVAPFDLKLGDISLTLGGQQNLAGNMRFDVAIDAPAGTLGQAAFQSLSSLTGGALQPGERVQVNLLVSGPMADPTVTAAGGGTATQLKDQAQAALEGEIANRTGTDVTLNRDSLKAQADDAVQAAKDSARNLAQQAQQQVRDSLAALADSAKQQAAQALEQKVEEQVGEEVTEKLKELRNKFKLPKRRDDE